METRNMPSPDESTTSFVAQKETYDILVFSHLRWDFVFQRPQHILSRLAKTQRILFIEEPIGFSEGDENTAVLSSPMPNLNVLKPRVRSIDDIGYVVEKYVTNTIVPVGWFYSGARKQSINHHTKSEPHAIINPNSQ